MPVSAGGRVGCGSGYPPIRVWIVFATGVEIIGDIPSAPDDHFACCPHRRMLESAIGRIGRAGGCPTVRGRIVSPASIGIGGAAPAPDDHFTPSPDGRVSGSANGRARDG